jgi:hypothetical protein
LAIATRWEIKSLLGISSSSHDSRISALIPEVEADYLKIRGKAFATDATDGRTVYPDGSKLTAARMVQFHLDGLTAGAKSESLGDYSADAEELLEGYPKSVVGRIRRYGGPERYLAQVEST